MSEEFEKWAEKNLMYGGDKWAAFQGYQMRQPEIDAIKAENNKFAESNVELLKENTTLKDEVERLRADANYYEWLCQKADFDYDYVTDLTWIKFPRLRHAGRVLDKQFIDKRIADNIQVGAAMKETK